MGDTLNPYYAAFRENCRSPIIWTLILSMWLAASHNSKASGVTVITHGLKGNADGWVEGMATAIPTHATFPGKSYTIYKLSFYYNNGYYLTWSRLAGIPPSAADSGEIIVTFDWSPFADGNSYNTYQIAPVLAQALTSTSFIGELNGHALCEQPIHLIGHSRGGSLMCETSRILGTNGIWVDHLTTLDPHPLNNDGFTLDAFLYTAVDAPCSTYENVLFHDNCWQNIDFFVYGEGVFGAYVRQLYELSGGYQNTSSPFYPHANTHLWYQGTVNLKTPATDTEAMITASERKNWWSADEAQGSVAGFYYSRLGHGDRTSTDAPLGTPIRDGYNQNWDLGAGTSANRTALSVNAGTWPNIVRLNVIGTNSVSQNSPVGVTLYYQYGGASNLTAQIIFDQDFNPYNANSTPIVSLRPPTTGIGSVSFYRSLSLPTTNITPGVYAVCARISDGPRSRYLYAPELVQIFPSWQPPGLDITLSDNKQAVIRVNGTSGQIIVLQRSLDLIDWIPTATNSLTTGHWIYTNSIPVEQQFYRAILSR